MSKCKACGAEIVWIRTPVKNSMPCNPAMITYWAAKGGKQRIVTPNGEVIACELDGELQNATGMGYVPHWATCPAKAHFRKKPTPKDENQTSLDL